MCYHVVFILITNLFSTLTMSPLKLFHDSIEPGGTLSLSVIIVIKSEEIILDHHHNQAACCFELGRIVITANCFLIFHTTEVVSGGKPTLRRNVDARDVVYIYTTREIVANSLLYT